MADRSPTIGVALDTDFAPVPDWFSWENSGGGVAVADIDGDGRLDLVVLLVDQATGGPNTAYYRVGSGTDDEVTVGRWSGWMPIPGGPEPATRPTRRPGDCSRRSALDRQLRRWPVRLERGRAASNALYRYWSMVGVKDALQESLVGHAREIEPVYERYAVPFFGWLSTSIAIGSALRLADAVVYDAYLLT